MNVEARSAFFAFSAVPLFFVLGGDAGVLVPREVVKEVKEAFRLSSLVRFALGRLPKADVVLGGCKGLGGTNFLRRTTERLTVTLNSSSGSFCRKS